MSDPGPRSSSVRTLAFGAAAFVAVALLLALLGSNRSDEAATATSSAPTTTTAPPTTSPTTAPPTTSPTTAPTTTEDPEIVARRALVADIDRRIDDYLADATPEQLAYRLVVTGLNGAALEQRLVGTIGSACVGGVFLTESNDNWQPENDPDALRTATTDLAEGIWSSDCRFRPLVATDAELGAVVRVPVDSPAGAPAWAERYVEGEPSNVLVDLRARVADYAAELHDLGIDLNFGAVADVDTGPDHFMARQERSFGDDPGIVAALTDAVVQGHCDADVAVTLKHFPNQGATLEDPHRRTSTAIGGRDLWETTGRLPYEHTSAPVVMTGHIFLDDVDPDLPATFSPAITTGLLRDELGFDGVVVTDDLSTMRGASDVIADAGDRAVAAVRAGADLVLFVDDRDIETVVAALVETMTADPEFLDRVRDAVGRSLRIRQVAREPELPLC